AAPANAMLRANPDGPIRRWRVDQQHVDRAGWPGMDELAHRRPSIGVAGRSHDGEPPAAEVALGDLGELSLRLCFWLGLWLGLWLRRYRGLRLCQWACVFPLI